MKKLIIVLIALLLAVPALAETKVAFVDLQKALNMSEAGKQAKSEIAKQAKKYEADFKKMQEELKKLKSELETQGMLLSDSAKAEKERNFQQSLKDMQRFQKDVQDELRQRDTEATRKLLEKMAPIVQEIGKKGKYQMIIEKTQGAVVYGDPSIDLTDELIKTLDAAK